MFVNSLEFRKENRTPLLPIGQKSFRLLTVLCVSILNKINEQIIFLYIYIHLTEMMQFGIDQTKNVRFKYLNTCSSDSLSSPPRSIGKISHTYFPIMRSTDTMCQTTTVACFCISSSSSSFFNRSLLSATHTRS
jgi:hypothetical protein